jgi:hypothetical protein
MKKITFYLFAFCLLLFTFSLHAQQIQLPDRSFETGWHNVLDGYYGPYLEYETEYFYTLNRLYGMHNAQGAANLTAFRDDVNPKDGTYSIKLTSGFVPVGAENVFLPGLVGTINKGFVDEFLGSDGEVTISVDWYGNDTPHALEGWYKYYPVNGDSALIDIGFHDWDGEVFVEKLIIKNPVSAWTHFSIKIPEQYWNKRFSEIRVLCVASAGVNFVDLQKCKGQLGSTLWIDDISLNYSDVGIKQNLFSTLKARTFPNPATTEVLNIELNENFDGKIMVYNLLGSTVIEENINGTECRLNISNLSTGNYIYKLMNENTIFAQGKFVVIK